MRLRRRCPAPRRVRAQGGKLLTPRAHARPAVHGKRPGGGEGANHVSEGTRAGEREPGWSPVARGHVAGAAGRGGAGCQRACGRARPRWAAARGGRPGGARCRAGGLRPPSPPPPGEAGAGEAGREPGSAPQVAAWRAGGEALRWDAEGLAVLPRAWSGDGRWGRAAGARGSAVWRSPGSPCARSRPLSTGRRRCRPGARLTPRRGRGPAPGCSRAST